MWFGKEASARLVILETTFKSLQQQVERNMFSGDQEFDQIKVDVKEVLHHIDNSNKQTLLSVQELKKDIENNVDKHYLTKIEHQKMLTSLRGSLLGDIRVEKDAASKQIKMFVLGATLALALCGWIYINVVK